MGFSVIFVYIDSNSFITFIKQRARQQTFKIKLCTQKVNKFYFIITISGLGIIDNNSFIVFSKQKAIEHYNLSFLVKIEKLSLITLAT